MRFLSFRFLSFLYFLNLLLEKLILLVDRVPLQFNLFLLLSKCINKGSQCHAREERVHGAKHVTELARVVRKSCKCADNQC